MGAVAPVLEELSQSIVSHFHLYRFECLFACSPLTSVPAFSNCPLNPRGAATAPVVAGDVASTFWDEGPACRRVFIRSRGLPIIIPAAPDT